MKKSLIFALELFLLASCTDSVQTKESISFEGEWYGTNTAFNNNGFSENPITFSVRVSITENTILITKTADNSVFLDLPFTLILSRQLPSTFTNSNNYAKPEQAPWVMVSSTSYIIYVTPSPSTLSLIDNNNLNPTTIDMTLTR
jgi:hypothetical protein